MRYNQNDIMATGEDLRHGYVCCVDSIFGYGELMAEVRAYNVLEI